MRVEIELKNYRCFPIDRPARFAIGPRLTGFIGTNNSGKSAALRFFYEFRELFSRLSPGSGNLNAMLASGDPVAIAGVQDQAEVFNNRNTFDMEVSFRQLDVQREGDADWAVPDLLAVSVDRSAMTWSLRLNDSAMASANRDGTKVVVDGERFELAPWFEFFQALHQSIYIGPFRNAIQVGAGQHYDLELGQAFVIIVLTTAAVRRPRFLFIDEPELNLHPSLQLSFLTTAAGYASDGVVFATHNIGLARAAGAAVYSVRAISSGRSEVHTLEGTPRLAEFLGELGLAGYQELGYDRVLLVEGPTDVAAVHQLLRLYGASHRIVLLHLGGSALINDDSALQLEEVTRLTKHISALVDSERSAENESLAERVAAFDRTCGELGIGCHVLARRALENYFTERAVTETKGDAYRALEPFESLRASDHPWGKDENWRIASAMTKEELQGTDLGTFLEQLAIAD